MRLFRRDPQAGTPAAAIVPFWDWWTELGAKAGAAALSAGTPEAVTPDLTEAVHAIHPDLAWELGAGNTAQHVLVVSAEGNPELRALARHWLLAAPEADATWEYADSRRADPDPEGITIRIGGREIAYGQARVGARREGTRVDVVVHHPAFAEIGEADIKQAAFLMLDSALGEVDVETWIGEVETAEVSPLEPIRLSGLRAVVRDLKQDFTDENGAPSWVMMEASGPSGQVLASAQVPLSPLTAPHLDTHVAVLVPYTDQTEQGFPGPDSLGALRALEDHLAQRMGASGRVVAHQSHRGMRVLHVYVDSTTPAVEQMRPAVTGWEQGRVRVQVTPDPGWENVSHLRG
jgi:Family of unknown function (DUF695)